MPSENNEKSVQKKFKNSKRVLLVIAFLLIFALYSFVSYRSEYLQILEIGENYTDVFTTNITYKYAIMITNFVLWFVAIYVTNKVIKRGLRKFFDEEKKTMPKLPNKSIALIMSGLIAIFASDIFINKTILFMNSTWFGGNPDPIFGQDISYYMFQKPFIEMIFTYGFAMLVALTIYTIVYYIVTFNIYFDGIDLKTLKNSAFFKQIITYVIIIAIFLVGLTLLKTQDILFEEFITLDNSSDTSLIGAGFTDVTIKLWGYRIFAVVILISTLFMIYYFRKEKYRKAVISILGIPAYLLALFFVMTGFELIFVNSNKLDKEKKYIGYNIENTRNAYNINIDEIELENSGTITQSDAIRYEDVIQNIPIVSKDITLATLEEYQDSVGFYSYPSTKLQNYSVNGKESLVYVSPREIVVDGISRTYDNKTYDYTHGFGSIITSAHSTDERGNLEYVQVDFTGKDEQVKITEPRIYFGMQTNSGIIVGTEYKKEFDYPITTSINAENTYSGTAGLNLSFFDRLMIGMTTNNLNLAFSSGFTEDSKVILNRNVIERAKRIMPYLVYDENPYVVIDKSGKQIWVLDAYTISENYPYSQKTTIEVDGKKTKINYIRNSVKVLIDSYDGTVKFYITDRTDPVAMAYYKLYPSLFMDIEQKIPEDIAEHITYPELLYNIQSEVYQKYHKVQSEVLYRSDDIWQIAKFNANNSSSNSGTQMEAYYTTIKTVDESKPKLGLVIPYTRYGRQNIISYLVGTYDAQSGPKLTLYKFASDSNILGPAQLNQQIEQDETITEELTTLNTTGTRLIKNMIIVPIDDTLLYVEPIYLLRPNEARTNKEAIPTLAKVVVASGNKLAIGNTLEEAMKNLLSKEAVSIEIENSEDTQDVIEEIIKANHNLQESSSNNDWEMMGKDIQKLQDLISQLETIQKEQQNTIDNSISNDLTNAMANNVLE